jgi:hypothetical protein
MTSPSLAAGFQLNQNLPTHANKAAWALQGEQNDGAAANDYMDGDVDEASQTISMISIEEQKAKYAGR